MSAPSVQSIVADLRCACGESYEFSGIEDEWQHICTCDYCGRRLSIQIDVLVQYDKREATA